MAFVAAGAEDKTITVRNLQSKPYIDLTLSVLKEFDLTVPHNRNYKEFYGSWSREARASRSTPRERKIGTVVATTCSSFSASPILT